MLHLTSPRDKAPELGEAEAPKLIPVDDLDENDSDQEHEFAPFQLKLLTWAWWWSELA